MTVSTTDTNNNLFKPLKVGQVTLNQRIAMAPLTRVRAQVEGAVPTDLMTTYYEQRASSPGTLLITEATFITERAGGYQGVPGIWSKEQIDGWAKVAAAIHAKGSFGYVQLWALGRTAGPEYLQSRGYDLVSSSNVARPLGPKNKLIGTDTVGTVPRPLTVDEIHEYVRDYAQAAKNSIEAGFDGVEIHAANGFLPHQFLHENINKRTDEYGGSVENRARFTLEIVDAVSAAIGASRVGIRFSPYYVGSDLGAGPGTLELYAYLLKELEERGLADEANKRLAYIHTVEGAIEVHNSIGNPILRRPLEFVRNVWTGGWIRAQRFDRKLALEIADVDDKVVIAFGKPFISNPDLVRRIKENLPWAEPDYETFYVPGAKGYTDYPFYS
ncbi:uncharacterized protein SAPINGB_P006268 [Magnusiomyces paraingens]|uniref:NADH:flavin oxidoreductase/NADH oxidase N-terminal domain-containing protein n=1 Tax=Magnusiomyces paraingens TaxID=2606893 RepID=A0A5E8CB67_9ASCO|nr:uncharacterized protein SAPINGB_P006268 [Saprochaete ingens]VVT58556.1 unnamed protein product [Saprochaete ingens]